MNEPQNLKDHQIKNKKNHKLTPILKRTPIFLKKPKLRTNDRNLRRKQNFQSNPK